MTAVAFVFCAVIVTALIWALMDVRESALGDWYDPADWNDARTWGQWA